ncbi:trypsin-like peptidase domain-containing protein [Natronosporangium hydrolyticum]|uniref:Trypsin-like peptidase domain-containing protein n=1 Tax=Natronosporangium hydrolyticum TaxID=2811111 RepID=A0A895YTR3_9ACTN|nr:trypsin-like peptidase domain-containing protein [Natronosporangium hydrolyticum]
MPARSADFWWSDGQHDPWRNPATPTEIVVAAPSAPDLPELEPVADPTAATGGRLRLVPVVLVTALLVGLVAGAMGGTLGYRFGAGQAPGTVLGAGPEADPAAVAQRPPESLAAVVDQVAPSVVTVRSTGRGGGTVGSGFVVSSDGHVLTNDHVLGAGGVPPTVTRHDGETVTADVVGRDAEADIAVLHVPQLAAPSVRFGDSETVAVGDQVLAFGSPLALANTVTSGIVSAVDRTIVAGDPGDETRYYAAIQTDAAVNQGNSGGPLVDAAGQVVGMNSVIKSVASSAEEAANIGLAFAIPISHAQRVAQELIDTGTARRTVIGAELDRVSRSAGGGVRLSAVVDDGPAAEAGLQAGDVLVRMQDRQLAEPADLIALVRKHPPGAVVTVEYLRGGAPAQAAVTLVADGD